MRVVLTSFGSFGDVNPFIGLGLALQSRGHVPVLAMPPIYREVVEAQGLGFHGVRPDLDPNDQALIRRIMEPRRGSEVLFKELLLPGLAQAFSDLREACDGADLLVTHPAALAGPIVGEMSGRPWASSVLAPMSFFSATDPIVPPPAPWVHGLLKRSAFASRVFRHLTDAMTRRWAEPVQRFRASLGLPLGANPILDGQHSPHLVLALFSRVLAEPQPDWPPHTVLTGPILYNGPSQGQEGADLTQFLASGPPPVVFTLGTSAVEAAGAFYEVSARAVRRLGIRAVLLIGRHAHNRPRDLGAGVLAIEYAPHAELFPQAAAVVHQGGVGTTHQALAAGKPTVVVPHAHDQHDNAMRVARLGVSRTIYPGRYTEAAVEETLHAILADPGCVTRADEVGRVVRAESGAATACEALERLSDAGHRGRPAPPSADAVVEAR